MSTDMRKSSNCLLRSTALFILLLITGFWLTGCASSSDSANLTSRLKKSDTPVLPTLKYLKLADNEWELKRLRLSKQGFEVLDERGNVSYQEGVFSLSDAYDSYRRDVERNDDYLEKTFWTGLEDVLNADIEGTPLGFLEYYGFYYLVVDEAHDIVLYSLGEKQTFTRGMSLEEFVNKAWAFFCYVQNSSTTIYGGDGINT